MQTKLKNIMKSLPIFMRINFTGRINRLRFFLYSLPFLLLHILSSILVFFIMLEITFTAHILVRASILLVYGLFLVILALFYLSLTARRLQDLDKNGLFSLLLLVIPVNILLIIYLLTFKGTDGANKYGLNPLQFENYRDYLETL